MPEAGAKSRWLEQLALAGLMVLAAWFYGWTATSAGSPLTAERPPYDLYNRLADGFLAGRTSFAEPAPPELAALADPYDPVQNAPYKKFHDVTYYRGRYYLYFGPTPALVLLAPWKALTGSSLPQNLAVVVFAWGAALLAVGMLRDIRRHWFPAASAGLMLTLTFALVFGSLWPVLLRRPLYYELAIASAAFFGLGAMWLLFRAQVGGGRRLGPLAGAGLCLGLAVGARPDYLFGGAAVVAVLLAQWWRAEAPRPTAERWPRLVRPAGALLLPLAICGLALMSYNYIRFGSITEFGTSYMLAGSNQEGVSQFSYRHVPINVYYHLLAPAHPSAYFPFLLVTSLPPFAASVGYGGQENMYGILFALPLLWLLAGAAGWRGTVPWAGWARPAAALALGNLVFLLFLMGAANRYQLDYVPPLMVLAALGVLRVETRTPGWRRGLGRAVWIPALVATVFFNLMVSLQHNELLKFHNPATYAKIAHAANRLTEPLTGATRRAGPLRVELTLPTGRTGQLEPLVVTGWSFRADFIYIYYTDERHIQIGFEHTSYGGPMSPPLEVDYSRPHVLEVEMGSLYPPADHPYFDGREDGEVDRLKRTLRVGLDGRTVHEGRYDFYDASPGDVSVGRNHVSTAFGRTFTGSIERVVRPAPRP